MSGHGSQGGHGDHEHTVHQHLEDLLLAIDNSAVFSKERQRVNHADSSFKEYHLEPTSGAKLESAFTNAAASYMHGLFGIGYDDPSQPAGQMKTWLGMVSETALNEANTAIKEGNRARLAELFQSAYLAQVRTAKSQSAITNKTNQTPEVQASIDAEVARLVSVNGVQVQPYVVGANYPAAVQTLAQSYNAAKNLQK